jgi:hypothetical protein
VDDYETIMRIIKKCYYLRLKTVVKIRR